MSCPKFSWAWQTAVLVGWLLPAPAPAGLNRWTSSGPTGGLVGRLAIDTRNPRTLYATGAGGGIFKTSDGGARWERYGTGLLATGGILSIAVDPSVSEVVYAGTTQGEVFQSTDAGRRWQKIFEIESPFGGQVLVNQIVIDPLDDRIVYLGTDRGVFQSLNRGSSWQATGLTSGVRCLAIDPTDTRILWAGATGGSLGIAAVVLKSYDSGATWTSGEIDGVIPHTGNSVFAVAVDPRTHDVLASTRTGIFQGGFRVTSSGRLASCFVFDPSNPNVVYACGSSEPFFDEGLGVLKSDDGGSTWRSVGPGDRTWVTSVVVDPTQSGTIYAAVPGPAPYPGEGVFKSLDAGAHWEAVTNGLSAHVAWTVEASRTRAGEIYAGVGSSFPLRRSHDDGSSWEVASTGITGQFISDFAIDPVNPQIVYAAGQLVWKSEDGGATWRQLDLPPSKYTLAIDPLHPFAVFAATSGFGPFSGSSDGGVYRSFNAGGTWSFSAAGLDNTDRGRTVFDLVVHPNGVIFAATGSGVFRSGDGGAFWSSAGLAGVRVSSLQIDAMELSTLYAGSYDGGVFKSTDVGTTWLAASNGLGGVSVSCILVDPVRPRTVYTGAAAAGVFRSTDGGTSWFSWNTGLDVLDVNALAISTTGAILHAATYGGGVFEFEFLPERSFSRVPARRLLPRTLPPRF